MKLKDLFSPIVLIVLGIAFLSVSLWVLFGKNSTSINKAIRLKYRLGGIILSLSFFTACEKDTIIPEVTCYAIAISTVRIPEELNKSELSIGDTLFIQILNSGFPNYSYSLIDSTKQIVFQEGLLQMADNSNCHIIPFKESFGYTGKVLIDIYGENNNEINKNQLIFSSSFVYNSGL